MKNYRAVLLVFATIFLWGCGHKGGAITLEVHKSIRALLVPFSKDTYRGPEILAVLDVAEARRRLWCARPEINAGLARELTEDERSQFAASDHGLITRLGCTPFYDLNDGDPEISIAYALNQVDAQLADKENCVSVGFVQPYVMGSLANCRQLTIVDASFRTLRLHAVLLPLLLAEDFRGIDAVYRTFAESTGLNLDDICGPAYAGRCKLRMMDFARKYRGNLRVTLFLGSLHHYQAPAGYKRQLLYMSNAPDPNFMSREEFADFMKIENRELVTLAIYHQADSANFGVYELNAGKVKPVCADDFVVARQGRYSKDRCTYYPGRTDRYRTYFDEAAGEKGPACKFTGF